MKNIWLYFQSEITCEGKGNNNKEDTGTSKGGEKMSGTAVEPLFPVLGKSNVMKSILEKWREGCR